MCVLHTTYDFRCKPSAFCVRCFFLITLITINNWIVDENIFNITSGTSTNDIFEPAIIVNGKPIHSQIAVPLVAKFGLMEESDSLDPSIILSILWYYSANRLDLFSRPSLRSFLIIIIYAVIIEMQIHIIPYQYGTRWPIYIYVVT